MSGRTAIATRMGFREQLRRPFLLALLVVVPLFFITRSIAITEPTPRAVPLPGGEIAFTDMKEIHGAVMAAITVAFLAGLIGVFVMQSALEGDRRLVVAGFRPRETIAARLGVVLAATLVVLSVSLAVTAFDFTPASWLPFAAATLCVGLIYAALGALAGALVGRLAATYLMLFVPMVDIGVAQNPMFGDANPDLWAKLLPGYGPMRVLVDGAFSQTFDATSELVLGLGWLAGLATITVLVLRRAIGVRSG